MRSFFDTPLVSAAMTLLVVVFLVFGVWPLHAVNNTEISDQYFEKAQEFVENGDVESAIIELKNGALQRIVDGARICRLWRLYGPRFPCLLVARAPSPAIFPFLSIVLCKTLKMRCKAIPIMFRPAYFSAKSMSA